MTATSSSNATPSPTQTATTPPSPVNRRRTFRVAASRLSMKAWRMDPYERLIDRPLPSRRIVLSTMDLSRHGAAVLLPAVAADASGKATAALGDRWRIELPLDEPDEALAIEARITSMLALPDGAQRVGLAFRDQLTATLVRRAESSIPKLLARLEREAIRDRANATAAPAA